ncbi:MAG: 3-oxoacyl-[acyl-carrier protein] reductase [Petroclostridium sp.]|uniref:SDR family NAD(P)-dependent oxidoreductase n=1 Tax=Petroclostridium xylanilyticum TaxID=1792311 RepID=UPI0012FFC2A8|nr:SDR family NAD(P)-dependent oxidoreductase [Petroclostridium xylanilyticum]MBZ4646764.1 3-oxoacyl-(acyl-carrier-protein) reductase [Clostridia bacterium]MDK2809498.1 3-oxoacyl-[acyl-carrier protein] reductase [Petroclostridium sp.]
MFDLKGDIAIVTGGSKGIGKAIVCALASAGATVIIADIDESSGQQICDELSANGLQAEMAKTDITDSKSVEALMDYTVKKYGKIDILVNNAGILGDASITEISDEDWDRLMAVNLTGAFYCCRAAVRHMLGKRKGKIINIASTGGKQGFPLAGVHYCASKGAIMALTRQLALQVSPQGIHVNAVAPGTTETEMIKNRSEEKKKFIISRIPMGRMGRPEDTAAAVVFLASKAGDYITGETIDVNGGLYMD